MSKAQIGDDPFPGLGRRGFYAEAARVAFAEATNHLIPEMPAPTDEYKPPPKPKRTPKGRGAGKRGRPNVEGERPWEAEGVSRMTWHRRQKKETGDG